MRTCTVRLAQDDRDPRRAAVGGRVAWQQHAQSTARERTRVRRAGGAHLGDGLGLEAVEAVDVVGDAGGVALEGRDDEQVLQVLVAAERAVLQDDHLEELDEL